MEKKKEFMQEVLRFLKLLENNFGKNVDIEELKNEFGEDYDRIIKYLNEERKSEEDKLIIGDKKSWRLNNYAFDRIQDIMSRLIQEDLSIKQTRFNFLLATATVLLAFTALISMGLSSLEFFYNTAISFWMRIVSIVFVLVVISLLIWFIKRITER